ncbi:calycin [Lucifera butyrica]|uniref:Calycin n=1 Tax=Lucifera butyrica TaxID=1351585 RepID=A0A498R856_9FIRM|nr:DUF1934 domain-containing protein [Lucifera butyrica]VBB06363.1 calycin [Lucifera butyrica]
MTNVIVTVIGTQKEDGGEAERIELVTAGRHYRKNGIDYISYEESAITGMEGTTTLLKLSPDSLTLVRMGRIEHKQQFCLGEKHTGTYITPFGRMETAVWTTRLEISLAAPAGSVELAYELEIDGRWQSTNTLSVTIREERNQEHERSAT